MSIKKVTIKSVEIKKTKMVDGNEVEYVYSKGINAGKNFVRVILELENHENKYATNAFPESKATLLKPGEIVLLNLVERPDGDKVWYDFNFPTKDEMAKLAAELVG